MFTLNEEDKTDLEVYQDFVNECPQPKGESTINKTFMKGYWAATQMISEGAEVLELFEKSYRKGVALDVERLKDELGDVIWGVACLANTYDVSLDEIIEMNISKLVNRHYGEVAKKD